MFLCCVRGSRWLSPAPSGQVAYIINLSFFLLKALSVPRPLDRRDPRCRRLFFFISLFIYLGLSFFCYPNSESSMAAYSIARDVSVPNLSVCPLESIPPRDRASATGSAAFVLCTITSLCLGPRSCSFLILIVCATVFSRHRVPMLFMNE